jgi:hypothetical protein
MEYLHPSRRWPLFSQCCKGEGKFIITWKKTGFDFLQRIFTDVDLYDPLCFNKIKEAIRIIEGLISEHDIQMSEKTDLVLDLNEDDDGEDLVDYYFADHELRIVVFVHEFPSSCLPHWCEVKGVSSGTHLRMSSLPKQLNNNFHLINMWLRARTGNAILVTQCLFNDDLQKYLPHDRWHCSAYPTCIELSDDLVCELRAMALHFIIGIVFMRHHTKGFILIFDSDCRTSPYANSPYTLAVLQEVLANTDSLKG